MKNYFLNKTFVYAFLISLACVVVILAIGFGIIWRYRTDVFGYFAKEYIKSGEQISNNSGQTVIEKQSVFTQESFVVDAVKKSSPAVVSIVISKDVPKYETFVDPNQLQDPFGGMLPGFSVTVPQVRQNGTERKDVGGGSGFLVSADGLIVTNKHVVADPAAYYTVYTNDGKKHSAKVIARDPVLDIALIKIDPLTQAGAGYSSLDLGDSDILQVGQSVIAIGNALGEFRNTVSVGVVSGLSRSITAGDASGNSETLDHVIQTDAAINPGNSGGPLLDLAGHVVGVDVATAQGSQNIGFALPINSVKSAINSVKATGKIIRPYLGIRYQTINAVLKDANNLTVDYGVLIKAGTNANEPAVISGGPADKAGIVENDIILNVNGVKVDDTNNFASLIREKNVGDIITLKILRKGVEKNVQVTLVAAPQS